MASLGTILLAEDDEAVRTAIALLLEAAGYEVLEASNGIEACTHLTAASSTIVMIILDLAMPLMSGFKFREQQLADPEFALIPTIVISGQTLGDDEIARLRARALLSKPFVFDELMRFVRAYAAPART